MLKKVLTWFCIICMLIGCGMILYPNAEYFMTRYEYDKVIDEIDEQQENNSKNMQDDPLYEDMMSYNQLIAANGQMDLKDAWSYQQPAFELLDYGIVDEAIGYLTIPSIDVNLPLYLGASKSNLSKGATVLGQTSMPIGGENTNCVIAAHRKMKKHPMFSDIEKVEIGDEVQVSNLWETLHYKVVAIVVIKPNDIDAVKIQEGKDMVTLITCHPYPYNYQRYVLYCQRSDNGHELGDIEIVKGEKIEFTQDEIDWERTLNRVGLIVVFLVLVFTIAVKCKKWLKNK